MLRDIKEQWLLFPVIFVVIVGIIFVWFSSLVFVSKLISSILWGVFSLHVWSFLSIILYWAGFVEIYFLNLVLSWNILVSSYMVFESFAG